jgi:hypothetical protein
MGRTDTRFVPILVNWGPILVGKLLVLLAGPTPVQERLALELQARLW